MCLAIPGRIVEFVDEEAQLAKADVSGVRRNVNVMLVNDAAAPIAVGDWVLIHVGFAISRIDAAEAHHTLDALGQIGAAFQEEMEAFQESRIE